MKNSIPVDSSAGDSDYSSEGYGEPMFAEDRAPSTYSQVAKAMSVGRIAHFADGINKPRDISTYSRFVPSPSFQYQDNEGIEVSNHLSATGQGMDPMSSVTADMVKLDQVKNPGGKATRKGDPNSLRKRGVTLSAKSVRESLDNEY